MLSEWAFGQKRKRRRRRRKKKNQNKQKGFSAFCGKAKKKKKKTSTKAKAVSEKIPKQLKKPAQKQKLFRKNSETAQNERCLWTNTAVSETVVVIN